MYTLEKILQILKERKFELQQKYSISEIGLFGSYARGDYKESSDIDILVDFDKRIDAFEYIQLAHDLEDLLNHKVDIVSRRGIKPQYLQFVEKNLIYV